MDVKTKAAVAFIPFLIAGGVGFSLAMPAYQDYTTKAQAVDDKKKEQEELTAKLANNKKVQKEKKDLETEIESLRASVPKKPEIEILNMDIERMCNDAGVELLSFKTAGKEELKKAGLDEATPETAGTNMSKGKEALANRVKQTLGGGAADKKKGAANAGVSPDGGLAKVTFDIKVIGDYAGLMALVKELETYQRVVAVSQISTHLPKSEDASKKTGPELPDDSIPNETDKQGDFHKLQSQLYLTAYYLP